MKDYYYYYYVLSLFLLLLLLLLLFSLLFLLLFVSQSDPAQFRLAKQRECNLILIIWLLFISVRFVRQQIPSATKFYQQLSFSYVPGIQVCRDTIVAFFSNWI